MTAIYVLLLSNLTSYVKPDITQIIVMSVLTLCSNIDEFSMEITKVSVLKYYYY